MVLIQIGPSCLGGKDFHHHQDSCWPNPVHVSSVSLIRINGVYSQESVRRIAAGMSEWAEHVSRHACSPEAMCGLLHFYNV